MGAWFIAVLLVMIVMNAFLFLTLTSITARINHQVNSFFTKKLDFCNDMVEQRLAELENLRNQVETQKKNLKNMPEKVPPQHSGAAAPAFHSSTPASYVNKDFRTQYCMVRECIPYDKRTIVEKILAVKAGEPETLGLAQKRSILGRFSYDTRYLLLTLEPQEQLQLIQEELTADEREILDEFCERNPEFSSSEFFSELQNECNLHDENIVVKTAPNVTLEFPNHPEIVHEGDEGICEGIKVFYRGQLYDYSL